ncbi:hypothetical protein EW146_g6644 [Bondarzewia mesenterica]|uniref:Autophagy-related protein 14 n=1 Tax=Bondarzewia mesenterica TaxID=1095465 RepID=A0A4S4LNW6_9AGAM|nr:hypothetical protein EW146_g6644 [Bondarzewia mesenterica]
MDCHNCELKQRQFYCDNCLRSQSLCSEVPLKSLRDFRLQVQHVITDRDEQVQKAIEALGNIEGARLRRADVASGQERLEAIQSALAKLKKDNDKTHQRLRSLRENLATRRRTLSQAKLLPSMPLDQLLSRETKQLTARSETLAKARGGLVSELVEVFNIVEVGGRPPIGGKAGIKGEWTIGDLVLPVPGDIRRTQLPSSRTSIRYPPDHMNAVITHMVHFLGLLTFYLGIQLPFQITWSGGKLGVGQPWIRSIKGTESGSWAKWTSKHCLHVSSSTPAPGTLTTESARDASTPSHPVSTSDSYIEAPVVSQSSFTTAYAMLLYDVCYLAHTQSVDIPLSQAGDVLSNLWAVCCSADLGRYVYLSISISRTLKTINPHFAVHISDVSDPLLTLTIHQNARHDRRSHRTNPLLPPPTPPAFPLDFAQLLQATAATPTSRARPSRPKSSRTSEHRVSISDSGRPSQERIAEEEEWHLIDDTDEPGP